MQPDQPKEFYSSFLNAEAKSLRRVQDNEMQIAEKARKFKEFAVRQQDVLADVENILLILGATEEHGAETERAAYGSIVAGGYYGGGTINTKPSFVDLTVRRFACVSPIVELGSHTNQGETFSSGVQVFMDCRETRKVVKTADEKAAQIIPSNEVTGFGLRYLKLTEGTDPVVVKTFYSNDAHLNTGLVDNNGVETLARLAFDTNQLAAINSGLNEISAVLEATDENH